MRKRPAPWNRLSDPLINVPIVSDMKSSPTHKSAVSMIHEGRPDYQSPVVWVVWTHRCAASEHVLVVPSLIHRFLSYPGPIQPAIRRWWILRRRWWLAKPGATQEQGPHPPGTCVSGGPI
jgi:hypothetical protein